MLFAPATPRTFMRFPHPSGSRTSHIGLLCCVLLALAWAALGPLPWVLLPVPHASHEHHHHGATAHVHHHDQLAASEIPGSPLHPEDHGCAPCQLLQHLSRAKPTAAPVALVAAVQVIAFNLPQARLPAPRSVHRVSVPRVRGPPTQLG
jgi:hypothetical protein